MKFVNLQSLVELHLSGCYKLGCVPDSFMGVA